MLLMTGKLGQCGKRYGWRTEEWTQTCAIMEGEPDGGIEDVATGTGGLWKTSESMHLVCLCVELDVICEDSRPPLTCLVENNDHCIERHSKSGVSRTAWMWKMCLYFLTLHVWERIKHIDFWTTEVFHTSLLAARLSLSLSLALSLSFLFCPQQT